MLGFIVINMKSNLVITSERPRKQRTRDLVQNQKNRDLPIEIRLKGPLYLTPSAQT